MGQHFRHFGHLFGNMQMHRGLWRKYHHIAQPGLTHRPQRMGCDAHQHINASRMAHRPLPKLRKPVHIIAKPQLPGDKCTPITTALLIQHRQQRQPNPRLPRRRHNPPRHFGQIGIGRATGLMVQIVKLRHPGITRFQHFHLLKRCNRLHITRAKMIQKPVHQAAPRPETIRRRPAPFRHPRHRALKRMAVQVHRRWQQTTQPLPFRRSARSHRSNPPTHHLNPHIARPTTGQQCSFCEQNSHLSLA